MREILSRLLATGGRLRSAVSRDESDGDQLATDGGTTVKTTRGDSLRNSLPIEWELVESAPFWLPPVLFAGFFVYGAIAWNFLLSLTDYSGLGGAQYESFDLSMYSRMLNDGAFWQAAQNTVVLLVVFTVLCLALGLFVAILIDQQIRFENTFRTIYLLPMSLSFVVTATMWAWVYNARNGVLNQLFRVFNLEGALVSLLRPAGVNAEVIQWLSWNTTALAAVIFALIWQFSGYAMVVFLAGLRAIPTEHYEAARVDGASTVRMYARIIIPQLRASAVSASVVLMVFALKAFDFIYALRGSQPGANMDILATMMYRVAFDSLRWAYGSAVAIVLFALALLVIGPYLYSEYRRGEL
ncbi:sugar ABC transporter permease [Haloarcula sp. 1CSR25-25]|uniref:carbohydrate ABC transporter permease n=1 Tax=Haloarcula sp. 1CSR25-25 TaxID=2862545 RepID=UPI002895CF58|nr:sugar ABC transporter permease [Haloarcula sp. 1CSR25-25]MDT3434569.1 sugar ABC transporter permease [Haloarcula sp. 1CSR25-25]